MRNSIYTFICFSLALAALLPRPASAMDCSPPAWVIEPPRDNAVYTAIGAASLHKGANAAAAAAYDNAISDIARQAGEDLSLAVLEAKSTDIPASRISENEVLYWTKILCFLNLTQLPVKASWTNSCENIYFVLVSTPRAQVRNAIEADLKRINDEAARQAIFTALSSLARESSPKKAIMDEGKSQPANFTLLLTSLEEAARRQEAGATEIRKLASSAEQVQKIKKALAAGEDSSVITRFISAAESFNRAWDLQQQNSNQNQEITDKVIAAYSQALDRDPEFAAAYYNRGIAYAAVGQYRSGIQDFTNAIKLDPQNPESYLARGNCYDNLGVTILALKDFGRAIALDPLYAAAYHSRASIYYKQRNRESALADYQKACELGLAVSCSVLEKIKR